MFLTWLPPNVVSRIKITAQGLPTEWSSFGLLYLHKIILKKLNANSKTLCLKNKQKIKN